MKGDRTPLFGGPSEYHQDMTSKGHLRGIISEAQVLGCQVKQYSGSCVFRHASTHAWSIIAEPVQGTKRCQSPSLKHSQGNCRQLLS